MSVASTVPTPPGSSGTAPAICAQAVDDEGRRNRRDDALGAHREDEHAEVEAPVEELEHDDREQALRDTRQVTLDGCEHGWKASAQGPGERRAEQRPGREDRSAAGDDERPLSRQRA